MINFLGIGGAFETKLKNNAAFYKYHNMMLLIDCGETVFCELIKKNLLNDLKKLNLLITHFHTDHIGSLGTVLFYSEKIGIESVNVIYPNKERLHELLNLFGVSGCNYKLIYPSECKDILIKEYPVVHYNFEAFSYLININNKNIYYSGDSKSIPDEILKMFYSKQIDFFYQDCRIKPNPYHLSIDELNALIPLMADRKKIYCMHINDEKEMAEIKRNGYMLVKKIK